MIQKMFKFFNTIRRVILLLHVVTAHVRSPWKGKTSYDCLLQQSEVNDLCITAECYEIANYMLERIDFSQNPCNNFYLFACGNYGKDSEFLSNMHGTALNKAKAAVLKILQEQETSTDSRLLKIMKRANRACVSGSRTVDEFKAILVEFGGFPFIDKNWKESSFSWTKFYEAARKYGYEANNMFSFLVGVNETDNYNKLLYVDKPKSYNEEVHKLRFEHWTINSTDKILGSDFIFETLTAFGVDVDASDAEIVDVYDFSVKVAQVYENGNFGYNIRTISDINVSCPQVPWLDIINILIAPKQYNTQDKIIVVCPLCLTKIYNLLLRTPERVLANYLLLNFILENIYLLKHELTLSLLKRTYTNSEENCQELTIKYFYMILDHVYIERFYNQNYTKIAQSIYDNLIAELKLTIQQRNLFATPDEKRLATEKANALIGKLAVNDDKIINYKKLEEYYKQINFTTAEDHFWEMQSFLLSETYNSLNKIERPSTFMRASTHVARNFLHHNTLHMSATVIGEAINENMPQYYNYGRLGFLLAHEISHAFEQRGILFDKRGNAKQLYNRNTLQNVENSGKCLAQQFNKYPIPGTNVTVPGNQTSNECIADNGGFYLSYHAYEKLPNVNTDATLPKFDKYTPKQMFWISFATSWCDKYDPAKYINILKKDTHPVNHLRIFVGLQNSEEFAQDFQCQKGSPMNPGTKCAFFNV